VNLYNPLNGPVISKAITEIPRILDVVDRKTVILVGAP